MARSFNGTDSRLNHSSAVTNSTTMTMSIWGYQSTVTKAVCLLQTANADLYEQQRYICLETVGGGIVAAWSNASSNWAGSQLTGFTANTWHHIGGVWDGDSSRTVYLNGTAGTTETTTRSITSETTVIGTYRGFGGYQQYWPGYLAEAAIWDAALTAAEMASLAKGFSPLLVRPTSLVAYWPLFGRISSEPDYVGGFTMTLTGGDANADHPRVFNPKPVVNVLGITAAAATKAMPIFSRPPRFLRRAA